ncbi:MAG: tetratricopeptide repeat protein [Candidatus Hydrogenedentes bacterium]|nr:tetratricopeptide repeat protein [Candidatus Hydrogenedentota bacterium]
MTFAVAATLLFHGATLFNGTFDRATDAYDAGNYEVAVNLYEQLVADGVVHADVFYNLGNAYYRLDALGPAIANYERALHLRPGFDAARHNLDICLQRTKRALAAPLPPAWEQGLLFWHVNLTPVFSFRMAVLSWLLFWGILSLRLWRPLPYLRRAAGVAFFVAVFFGLSSWTKEHPHLIAVAATESLPVHYAKGPEEKARFELFEGDRVSIDRRESGWARVTTADGEKGWAEESGLALVGPPYLRPALGTTDTAGGTS